MMLVVGLAGAPWLRAQTPLELRQEFGVAVQEVGEAYAYFDTKATRWQDVPALYAADLERVTSREGFIGLLERVLEELYDSHLQLTVNLEHSPRLVPSGTDLWAEWRDGQAIVTHVRDHSDAERARIAPGAIVVAIDGVPIADAVEARLGRSYSHSVRAARDWALRAVLAGRHQTRRRLQIEQAGVLRAVELPAADQFTTSRALLESSEIRRGIGYIRLNDSLGNSTVVAEFDRALEGLRHTRGLILDLRDTPSGGNSSVARGILGRFVDREQAYQKHVLPSEERVTGVRRSWLEHVSPRGHFAYAQPVAVLVGRWTGSMGEGLAIGFDATKAGTVIGTAMAGLVGATTQVSLTRTGIGINVPTERLYHVNGTPREEFRPRVRVDLNGRESGRDAFVEAALQALTP